MTPEEAKNAWGVYFVGDLMFVVTEEQHKKLSSGRMSIEYNIATGEWEFVEVKNADDNS